MLYQGWQRIHVQEDNYEVAWVISVPVAELVRDTAYAYDPAYVTTPSAASRGGPRDLRKDRHSTKYHQSKPNTARASPSWASSPEEREGGRMDRIEDAYGRQAALRLHIGSRHALANWCDIDDPEGYHAHEHDGPGTIRGHPRASLDYDEAKALAVEAEGFEDDGGDI